MDSNHDVKLNISTLTRNVVGSYTEKDDVKAYGVLIEQMMKSPSFGGTIPVTLEELIMSCTAKESNLRPSFSSILEILQSNFETM
jgi:hypothetical protein